MRLHRAVSRLVAVLTGTLLMAGLVAPGATAAPDADALLVVAQPDDVEVVEGEDARLRIHADGVADYRWQLLDEEAGADEDAWQDIDPARHPSAGTAELLLTAVTPADEASYRVAMTGVGGDVVLSEPAGLTVLPADRPDEAGEQDDAGAPDDAGAEDETAADEPAEDGTAGETAGEPDQGSLLEMAPSADAASPAASTDAADLAVSLQPEHVSAARGASARLLAESTGGTQPVTVQWYRSATLSATTEPTGTWVPIDRATSTQFTFAAGTNPHQGNRWYRATFADADGDTVTTNAVRLTILAAPVLTEHPSGQTVSVGESATFTAAAEDYDSVTWQSTRSVLPNGDVDGSTWADVPGTDATSLIVPDVQASDHDTYYRAVFTNEAGSRESQPAQLRVLERLDTVTPVVVTGESYGPVQPNTTFSVSAPNAVVHGEDIVIEGFGYLAVDGERGSIANALVDAEFSGDVRALNTTRIVYNPQTGAEYSDKRGHNVVQAGGAGPSNVGGQTVVGAGGAAVLETYPGWDPGYFRVVIPWPDETTTDRPAEFFEEHWAPGTQHTVRFLTGTLLQPGSSDYQRGISVRFTIVDEPTAPAVAPQVTVQPSDTSVVAGEVAELTAAASGTPAPTVQWESRSPGGQWTVIAGATSETLRLTDVTTELHGTQYRAYFTNVAGSATTEPATLSVAASAVEVAAHPRDRTVETGETARFTAEARGTEITTQWERSLDGETWEAIPGARYATYSIGSTVADDAQWQYRARFSNPGTPDGVVTDAASLTLTPRENEREHGGRSYGPDGHAGTEFCFTGPERVVVGEDIVIRGTGGYLATDAATGSVVNFFLDGLYSGDPNTIYVKDPVHHPVTGARVDDRRTHAMVQAQPDGTWTATIPWPTVATVSPTQDGSGSFTQQQLDERFGPGTTHAVRMLSGSLLSSPVDVQRGATLLFTVVEDLADPIPVREPIYQHETYSSPAPGDDATAWVPSTADSGLRFPLTGTGWLSKDGAAGSVVDVRLTDENGDYYERPAVDEPADPADPSLWQRVHVRADGVLDTRVDLPESVTSGSYVAVELRTHDDGTASGDVARRWTSEPLTVDGMPWTVPVTEGCVAPASAATYQLAPGMDVPAANGGGTIRLVGEDWCNSVTGEGSYIAIKINDGAYSHRGDASATVFDAELGQETGLCEADICRTNSTIWYVIEAAADGSFDVDIPLPDRGNTQPAFGEGSYTLRIMTGTLAGDPYYGGVRESSRTMQTPEFTVVCETCDTENATPGRPSLPPDPLHADRELTAATQGGVAVQQGGDQWRVTVPGASAGDWVYVNVYQGPSPRFPWGATWFQVGADGRVSVPLTGVTIPVGTNKLSVQDRSGNLLGWAEVTVAAPPPQGPGQTHVPPPASTGAPGGGGAGGSGAGGHGPGGSGPAVRPPAWTAPAAMFTAQPRPAEPADQPVGEYDDLDDGNVGEVSAVETDEELVVTVPGVEPGHWVFLHLYTEDGRVVPIDWVQVGTDGTFTVTLGELPDGMHRLTLTGADGELLGWLAVNGPQPLAEAVAADGDAAGAPGAEAVPGPLAGSVPGGTSTSASDHTSTLILSGLALLVLAGAAIAVIVLRGPTPGTTTA